MASRPPRRPQDPADEPESPIPPVVARLWSRSQATRSEPRRTLHPARIVAAAIEIADEQGLPALSMARLAERLGCAPMSLYRHVANKDELLSLMLDTAPGDPPAIEADGDWRGALERWARALLAVYLRHPWILEITAGRPPIEPGQVSWLEHGLRAVEGLPLPVEERYAVVMAALYYVRGQAQILAGALRRDGDPLARDYGRILAGLLDRERFPALTELIASGAFEPRDAEPTGLTEYGLARFLDGVERHVARTAGSENRER